MGILSSLFGANDIEKLEAQRDVARLVKALDNKVKSVRRDAASALGRIGDARAVDALVSALGNKKNNLKTRRSATFAIGEIGDKRAIDPLIAALKDPSSGIRREAVAALLTYGDVAFPPLVSMVEDPSVRVRAAILKMLKGYGDVALRPLITMLGDPDATVRRDVVAALTKRGEAGANLIIAAFDNEQNSAAWKAGAADVLGKIGDTRAVDPLIVVLKDKNITVCKAAAEALGSIRDTRAVDALISALENMDNNPETRNAAVSALGEIGDTRAIDPLIAVLLDENKTGSKAALKTLEKNGWLPPKIRTKIIERDKARKKSGAIERDKKKRQKSRDAEIRVGNQLIIAAAFSTATNVKELLDQGIDVDVRDWRGGGVERR